MNNHNFAPGQMNQNAAAVFMGCCARTFKKKYKPKLPYIQEEGKSEILFRQTDLQRLIDKNFKSKATWPDERKHSPGSTEIQKQEFGNSTKSSKTTDAFTEALERRNTPKQKKERSAG